jgi:hypothetical protein
LNLDEVVPDACRPVQCRRGHGVCQAGDFTAVVRVVAVVSVAVEATDHHAMAAVAAGRRVRGAGGAAALAVGKVEIVEVVGPVEDDAAFAGPLGLRPLAQTDSMDGTRWRQRKHDRVTMATIDAAAADTGTVDSMALPRPWGPC